MQARIKAKAIAINTFLPKNGYRPLDMNIYTQQRYTTSFYLPPVYSPQQQFPLYSLIAPQTWSTTHSYLDPSLVSLLLTEELRVLLRVGIFVVKFRGVVWEACVSWKWDQAADSCWKAVIQISSHGIQDWEQYLVSNWNYGSLLHFLVFEAEVILRESQSFLLLMAK